MLCEEIKAFLEIRPEPNQIGLISVSGGELVQSGGGQARRKDLDGNVRLPASRARTASQ